MGWQPLTKLLIRWARKLVGRIKRKFGYGRQEVWSRYTEKARKVIVYAEEEARRLGHNWIYPEHFLLGLTRVTDSFGACLLKWMGISLESIRREVERFTPQGDLGLGQEIKLTSRGRRVLQLVCKEADELGDDHIGTEHLLLGILCEREGMAAQILNKLGVDIELVRTEVIKLHSIEGPGEPQQPHQ